MIPVLCVMKGSNYYSIPNLDIYDKKRDAYNYAGADMVIAHPPCQQWSRLRKFAIDDKYERDLAPFCYEIVRKNGGILEHPAGSALFRYVNAPRSQIYSVDQSWWGFPARKRTYLFVQDLELLPYPISLDIPKMNVHQMHSSQRSKMTLSMCEWMVKNIFTKIWKNQKALIH